ncbi:TIGR00270 family protein [Candidatus Woesearchaeota archaeon]|nr:TIGR00270 family protein [Candidatus Woesearchaeota archaeon]
MAQCDMCGQDGAALQARIEGTLLTVCQKCASFGEVVSRPQPRAKTFIPERKKECFVIVPDYSQKIKNARERAGLKQDELATKLNERASLLQKIESGDVPPDVALAKKLESFLHITLVVPYSEEENKEKKQAASAELTIGDILKVRK